jgi:hypothetical protein
MPNFCGTIIQTLEGENQLSKGEERNIVWAAGSMLGGGLDTVSYSLTQDFSNN